MGSVVKTQRCPRNGNCWSLMNYSSRTPKQRARYQPYVCSSVERRASIRDRLWHRSQ